MECSCLLLVDGRTQRMNPLQLQRLELEPPFPLLPWCLRACGPKDLWCREDADSFTGAAPLRAFMPVMDRLGCMQHMWLQGFVLLAGLRILHYGFGRSHPGYDSLQRCHLPYIRTTSVLSIFPCPCIIAAENRSLGP
jgi:hypothetical protein